MKMLKQQNGASLLEFLVTIPILFMLAITAVEFGAVFTRLNTVTKSVQDAARYLSTDKAKVSGNAGAAKNLIQYGSLSAGTQLLPGTFAFPAPFPDTTTDANHVIVSVTYKHTPVMGKALKNLLKFVGMTVDHSFLSLDLKASSAMRYVQ